MNGTLRTRRSFLKQSAAAAALAGVPLVAAAAVEKPDLTIGLPNDDLTYLPLYLSATRGWKDQGLNVQLVAFRGDGDVTAALAGGSIDVACASVIGLVNMITAGQPAMGFYAGFNQTGFTWVSQPAIKTWADLKGKRLGISTFGSLSDGLTRYVLKKHNLVPEKDVFLVNAGGGPNAFPALKAGKLDAAFMVSPFTWQAQELGMNVLGTQAKEIAPQWPLHIFSAKTSFLQANPNTVLALLRAQVTAIRTARADRDLSVNVLMEKLKFTKPYAERSYDEVIGGYDERGRLPEKVMPVFWNVLMQTGTVTSPWPAMRFLDPHYISSFNQWAPRA